MDGLKSQVKQTAKQAAIKTAKQIAAEPLEVSRRIRGQVMSIPDVSTQSTSEVEVGERSDSSEVREKFSLDQKQEEVKKEKAKRLMNAYEAEIEDIRKSKKQQEVQEAQTQELEEEKHKEEEKTEVLVEPITKPKRGLFAGLKTRLKRLQSRGEIRMPPSG